jgi:hypothetical protein
VRDLVPGKRYRFSYEVRVDAVGDAVIEGTSRRLGDSLMQEATVEQLPDPLPTTPGSVIVHDLIGVAMYSQPDDDSLDYPWVDSHGDFHKSTEVTGATVLFDAGASS